MTSPFPSDLIDLLAAFDEHKVEYLLVGGQAVALHGHPRFTKDSDIWLRNNEQNVRRAQQALVDFGAPQSVVEGIAQATGLDVVWMGYPPTRIDLLKEVPGGDFESCWARRVELDVEGEHLHLIDRESLIALKRASGRIQDLADAEALEIQTEKS